MRILFINHTARVSGGERSLLIALDALPTSIEAFVASPPGELADRVTALGVPWCRLAPAEGSFRFHPVGTPRALLDIGLAGRQALRLSRRLKADLIHTNSVRAGLVALVARMLGGPPVVVHVRDVLPEFVAGRAVRRALSHADLCVANSGHTAASLHLPAGQVAVLHSPVDSRRFSDLPDCVSARHILGFPDDTVMLGVIGQLTPWKGQDDGIRVLAQLRREHPGAQLLVVGSVRFSGAGTRYDNDRYARSLHELSASLDVTDAVRFLGEREDVPLILRAIDVLLVPSWEEPFGRVVAEALVAGTPVVATDLGGPRELLAGGGGRLVPPRDPPAMAAAVDDILAGDKLRTPRPVVVAEEHVAALVDVWQGVLARASSRPADDVLDPDPLLPRSSLATNRRR